MIFRILILVLLPLITLFAVVSLGMGTVQIPLSDALRAFFGHGDIGDILIVREIRLPRTLLAILIGAALGLSGAVLQGWLRNPLADPGVIGISTMAALGAVLTIYFGAYTAFPLALPLAGIAGAAIGVLLIRAMAGSEGDALTVVLSGAAIQSFAAAGIALALNLAPNPYAALEIAFWLMGSLKDRSLLHVQLAAPFILTGAAILFATGKGLNGLSLGERTARTLGIHLARLQWLVVIGTALVVGAAVAVAGAVGFIGLIVPHCLRPLVGHQPKRLLLPSALAGAALLLAADIAARSMPASQELKLGVLASLIGAPFFLILLLRLRKGTL